MFAAPPDVTARVFATLPKELEGDASTSYWLQQQHKGRQLPAFFEGPSFDRDGNLYCVDVAYGRIFRINPQGEFHLVVQYDGEPTGLKIHRDGRIFVADYRDRTSDVWGKSVSVRVDLGCRRIIQKKNISTQH